MRPLTVEATGDHLGQLFVTPGLVCPWQAPGSLAIGRTAVPPLAATNMISEWGLS